MTNINKISKILLQILFVIFLSLLINCSNNSKTTQNNYNIEKLEIAEKKLQKQILIQEMLEASNRLQHIGWTMLSKNAKFCKKKSNFSYGATYLSVLDLPKEDHSLFISIFNKDIKKALFKKYGLSAFPIVASVARNSPASRANLLPGDKVLKINDEIPNNFRDKLHGALINKSLLKLQVLREEKILNITLLGKQVCNYNIQALPSGFPNAFADGQKIFITLAAIKLARSDDELAFLIGHELAHNIYDFNSKETSEAFTTAINYKDRPKIREFKNLFVWSSEKKEIRADVKAVRFAHEGGFDLKNINDYWRRLSVFNPELIEKSSSIYMGNAYRASLIKETISNIKKQEYEKK